jgi:hypothetical protein
VTAAENCIAKLVALGFSANILSFKKHLDDLYYRLYRLPNRNNTRNAAIRSISRL